MSAPDEGSSDEYSESSVAIMEKGSAEAKPKAQILANVSVSGAMINNFN